MNFKYHGKIISGVSPRILSFDAPVADLAAPTTRIPYNPKVALRRGLNVLRPHQLESGCKPPEPRARGAPHCRKAAPRPDHVEPHRVWIRLRSAGDPARACDPRIAQLRTRSKGPAHSSPVSGRLLHEPRQ